MKSSRSLFSAITPVVSLLVVFVGIVQLRSELWLSGAICLAVAVGSFVTGIVLLERRPITGDELEEVRPDLGPAVCWALIVCLIGIAVVYGADDVSTPQTDRLAAGAWVLALASSLLVVWRPGSAPRPGSAQVSLGARWTANRAEIITVGAMLSVALLLRTVALSTHPYPWTGDEFSISMEARRIVDGEVTDFFSTGWSLQSSWSFVPPAITQMIGAEGIVGVRLTSAIAGTLAVLFVFLAARQLFGRSIGLMAGAFLTTLPYHVHFSRLGVHNVQDSLMSSMLVWLLAKAAQQDDLRYAYTAGLAGGLCFSTYAGTRLAPAIGVAMLVFALIRERERAAARLRQLMVFGVGIVLAVAPQAVFFLRHRDIFVGRFSQEGILFDGRLAQHAAAAGQSEWEFLLDQFQRTTLVFIASPARGLFYNSPEPYLTIIGSTLFLLGIGYAIAHALETRYFVLLVWFWSVVVLGGVLTANPPANTRLLMTTPVVAMFMAIGAAKVVEHLQRLRLVREPVALVLCAFVVVVGYQNVDFYMGEYRSNRYLADVNSEFAMEVGLAASDLGDGAAIYVLGAPRVFTTFPTLTALTRGHQLADLDAGSLAALQVPSGTPLAFYAIPTNRPLLDEIRRRFPGGRLDVVHRKPVPDEILFESYVVTRHDVGSALQGLGPTRVESIDELERLDRSKRSSRREARSASGGR